MGFLTALLALACTAAVADQVPADAGAAVYSVKHGQVTAMLIS